MAKALKFAAKSKKTEPTPLQVVEGIVNDAVDLGDDTSAATDVAAHLLNRLGEILPGLPLAALQARIAELESQLAQRDAELVTARRAATRAADAAPAATKQLSDPNKFSSMMGGRNGNEDALNYVLQHPLGNYFKTPAPASRDKYARLIGDSEGPLHYLLTAENLPVRELRAAVVLYAPQHVSFVPLLYGIIHPSDMKAILALYQERDEEGEGVARRPGVKAAGAKTGRAKTDYDLFAVPMKSTKQEVLDTIVSVGNFFENKTKSKTYAVYTASELAELEGEMTFGELRELASKVFDAQQFRPGVWGMLSKESKAVMAAMQ